MWLGYWNHFDKLLRHNLGSRIDSLFIETIENLFSASYASGENKIIYLTKASKTFDLLKFLLYVSWDIKALDNKKYITLSKELNEIGRMLGGWHKKTKAP